MFEAHTRAALVIAAYTAEQNRIRALRGFDALALHPDDEDLQTVASDVIADILHAAHAVAPGIDVAALTERALRTYDGDFEDEAQS